MFNYLYEGQQHTDTSTDYLARLGMDDESIKSLQRDAADYDERQKLEFIQQRNEILTGSDWISIRNEEESALGLSKSLDQQELESVLMWRQAIRDLPGNQYSRGWEWPPIPDVIAPDFPDYPPE